MNKAERLFQLMSILQSRRRAITADQLAGKMNVSVRTIYRDIQALELSGIFIEGEPGVVTKANSPQPLLSGMNKFLELLHITFRRLIIIGRE